MSRLARGAGVVVVTSGSRRRAEDFARCHELIPLSVLTAREAHALGRGLRRAVLALHPDAVMVHTADWQRIVYPRLYQAAAGLCTPVPAYLGDAARETVTPFRQPVMARALGGAVVDVLTAGVLAGVEALRRPATRRPPRPGGRTPGQADWVLAVWRGPVDDVMVGGSVSHIAGILGGFRSLGLRVAIASMRRLPDQILRVADEVVEPRTLPSGGRFSHGMFELTCNQALREACRPVAARLRPAFIYQRHEYLLTAGRDVASECGIPLVLEWNASELWAHANWRSAQPLAPVEDPLLRRLAARAERSMVTSASVVAAVSEPAADMAREAGAEPDDVLVSPNAVDLAGIPYDAARLTRAPGDAALLGWVGTFGPWHGAAVAVEALALLPPPVRLVMVGDGHERNTCQQRARELGLADRVEWTGTLPREEALSRLAGCDVLLSPHVPLSDRPFFGSPTKLFEYMALGRPIVASRLEQIGEVLADRETALLVAPGQPHALAAATNELLADPRLAECLGRAARLVAESEHTWEMRARSMLRALARLGAAS